MTPPDAASIDWTQISLWAGGIATVLTSVGVSVWLGVQKATAIAQGQPVPATTVHKTDVYTTDSLALERLTNAIEAANVLAIEGNILRREATDERRKLHQALDVNTEMTERSMQVISELRVEVRELTREMVRAQK